jgi:hypothetical protein
VGGPSPPPPPRTRVVGEEPVRAAFVRLDG